MHTFVTVPLTCHWAGHGYMVLLSPVDHCVLMGGVWEGWYGGKGGSEGDWQRRNGKKNK